MIRGLVVTEAIAPLADAVVELDEGARTARTDEDGLFTFIDVEPGGHRLRATMAGYFPALAELQVEADQTAPMIRLVLRAENAVTPYAQTMKWDGIIQCSFSVLGTGGNCVPAVFGDDFSEIYQFEGRPDWVQSEMVWESTQALGEDMSIEFWCNRGPPCEADSLLIIGAVGPSPQTLILERGLIDKWQVGDPDQILYIRVDGRSAGDVPEVVLSQPFTVYTTVFYNTVPPQGWTFVKDGEPPV